MPPSWVFVSLFAGVWTVRCGERRCVLTCGSSGLCGFVRVDMEGVW